VELSFGLSTGAWRASPAGTSARTYVASSVLLAGRDVASSVLAWRQRGWALLRPRVSGRLHDGDIGGWGQSGGLALRWLSSRHLDGLFRFSCLGWELGSRYRWIELGLFSRLEAYCLCLCGLGLGLFSAYKHLHD
jgi:hypothetical protein